jgi:YggT family protein
MTAYNLARLIDLLANLLSLLVFIWAVLSWILPPYHPVREALDRIMDPLLAPIRKVVPLVGMFDISPIILMVLIQLLSRLLIGLILSFQ